MARYSPVLAYFLTWQCYGLWLHGDERGSVDHAHNEFGTPVRTPDLSLWQRKFESMPREGYVLTTQARQIVDAVIREHAQRRNWSIHALNVRTTHVHVIISASAHTPEQVMEQLKMWATRRLQDAGMSVRGHRPWALHGSTRYIFDEEVLRDKIRYVMEEQ